MMWQVEVPMIASIWPASVDCAAGAVTWASTLPTATTMPAGSPVQAAASSVSRPAASPRWPEAGWSFSSTKPPKSGCSSVRKSRVG